MGPLALLQVAFTQRTLLGIRKSAGFIRNLQANYSTSEGTGAHRQGVISQRPPRRTAEESLLSLNPSPLLLGVLQGGEGAFEVALPSDILCLLKQ